MSDKNKIAQSRYNSSSSVSVIGENTIYQGDIQFEGVLHINGDFYGNIKGNGDLGVGLTGRARSTIHANNVIISGLVLGEIIAHGRVSVKSSAIVIGNIQAGNLIIEAGSIFQGELKIKNSKEQQKVSKTSAYMTYNNTEEKTETTQTNNSQEQNLSVLQEEAKKKELESKDAETLTNQNYMGKKNKYSVWKS